MVIKQIQFNRRELAGAFGDIGTDLPLIVAMILAAGLHAPSVLIVFGLMQIMTGFVYKMPMPVQPLKAMATLVIAQKIVAPVLLGAGIAIGAVMLVLAASGILDRFAKLIPKSVIRGLQLGLGITLCSLACKEYMGADGTGGYVLAFCAFLLIVFFMDNLRFPASLLVIGLGLVYAFLWKVDLMVLYQACGIQVPQFALPQTDAIWQGFLLLALPQLPLSLGNSILATQQVSRDFFPERTDLTVKKIGFTYALMNLTAPMLGGIPVCHGAGGMVGHYAFGGRTGGSVVLYGMLYLFIGLFFGEGFAELIRLFPLPMLGVILLFEGVSLMLLLKDIVPDKRGLVVAVLVGMAAFGLPYGFVVALALGAMLHYLPIRLHVLQNIGNTDR